MKAEKTTQRGAGTKKRTEQKPTGTQRPEKHMKSGSKAKQDRKAK